MSLPAGDCGQNMPPYEAVKPGKYGKRVLLERIMRLLLAVKLAQHNWLEAYIDATQSLHGELPLCADAMSLLRKLWNDHETSAAPLLHLGQVRQRWHPT